jgi:hypothetical protein
MTELRDARLRKALHEAPDAALQPPQRTRDAVHAAAHAAVQPAWRRWWRSAGDHRTPWGAALATVALATLVTVMWEGRGIPGARREAAPETAPIPAAQAPALEAASVPAALPGTAASEPHGPAAVAPSAPPVSPAKPGAAAVPLRERPLAPPRADPPPPAMEAATEGSPAGKSAPHDPVTRDAGTSAAEGLSRAASASASASAAAAEDVRAAAPPPRVVAAASAPTPAPAPPAPAVAQRQGATLAPQAALRASPASLPWTQLRIEAGGRSVVVARMQAGELPALVTSLLASPSDDADATAVATLRLELAQGDEAIGVLDLVGDRWRWSPLRGARDARLLRAEPGIAAALREETQKLLAR